MKTTISLNADDWSLVNPKVSKTKCGKFGALLCAGAVMLIAASAPAQNLFVAGGSTGNVYEITPGGVQSTFISGLASVGGMAFDGAGNLFVTDNNLIEKITPTGSISTFGSIASGAFTTGGIAFDSAGNLFVSDLNSNIDKFTPSGSQSVFAHGFAAPSALAFNNAGNLFLASSASGNIYQFTTSGASSVFASGLSWPAGLAFDSTGNLFATAFLSGNIYKITPSGTQTTFASGFSYPQSLAFDSAGNLYTFYVGNTSSTITKITPGGAQSTFASGFTTPVTDGLAFQNEPLPVPEPSVMGLLALGMFGITRLRWRQR